MSENAHYLKGMAKINENHFEEAIELFTLAINDEPKNPFFYNQRAVAYLNLHRYDLSMFDMNMSIYLDDQYAYFYSCRAFLKTRMQDMDGAVDDYEQSLELDPQNEITYNNMALLLEQIGSMDMAKKIRKKGDELIGYDPEKRKLNKEGTYMVDEQVPLKSNEPDSSAIPTSEDDKNTTQKKRKKLAKDVFTSKSAFKEFLSFIGNGFKLKDDNYDTSKDDKNDQSGKS
ncbi:MAG: hypothetical protein HUJ25_01295 [Crocinitomicaceae bacterium]|nr:hypothetical protein [Crocinitomicaceae bacterium]